jgi:hypothetical protein
MLVLSLFVAVSVVTVGGCFPRFGGSKRCFFPFFLGGEFFSFFYLKERYVFDL